jgi:hypothetical protein
MIAQKIFFIFIAGNIVSKTGFAIGAVIFGQDAKISILIRLIYAVIAGMNLRPTYFMMRIGIIIVQHAVEKE